MLCNIPIARLHRTTGIIQDIYRTVSQSALCFIIEHQGRSIGECWLQRMNLERVLREYPGFDLRRIDLMIGEKALWGQGLGTEVIRLLTDLAFHHEKADYVFGVDIADYNPRSRRAFEKNDYRLIAHHPQPPCTGAVHAGPACEESAVGIPGVCGPLVFRPSDRKCDPLGLARTRRKRCGAIFPSIG